LSRGKTGSHFSGSCSEGKGGTVRRDKKLTAPCRCFEILAGKCGFASQPERRNDGSDRSGIGNANAVLT
jgi:hypothetical protein